jgi:hypothetical protein
MSFLVDDDRVPWLGLCTESYLVGHDSCGNEYGVFLAEEISNGALKRVDRGIVVVDVVSDNGIRNCLTHLGRWLRDSVASQIDHRFFPFDVMAVVSD